MTLRGIPLADLLHQALDTLGESVVVTDAGEHIIYVNRAFTEVYGHDPHAIIGVPLRMLWEDADDWRNVETRIKAGFDGRWETEAIHRRRDGQSFPVNLVLSILRRAADGVAAVVIASRPYPDDGRLEEALKRISTIDGLTGVPDRGRFEDALDHEWRRAWRLAGALSVVLVRVDDLENQPRKVAEARLRRVAGSLCAALHRAGDLAARWDNETFALLLPGVVDHQADAFVEGLKKEFAPRAPGEKGAGAEAIGTTISVATAAPSRGGSPAILMEHALKALQGAPPGGTHFVNLNS